MRSKTILAALALAAALAGRAQTMPATPAESVSGRAVAPAEAVRGRLTVLVASFSRQAGDGAQAWVRALSADPAAARAQLLQLVMLESAPGFVRSLIRSSMRKSMSAAEQDRALIVTRDEKAWRAWFGVDNDRDPWVTVLDADGHILWHGHGQAGQLEPLVVAAVK